MTTSLDNTFPLIVPANYYSKEMWDLPHHDLANKSFILTWVVFGSAATMNYMTRAQYQDLTFNDENWQQKSFENLRHSISDNENFFTQYKKSFDGQRLIFLSFMNSDGIGSSRILLSNELTKAFPNGYYLAFPDRSCGIAIAKDISDKELTETKKMIEGMYKNATTAMSGQLHPISDFLLPAQWTEPIDKGFSEVLTNEIYKLSVK